MNLQIAAASLIAASYFLVLALSVPYLPGLDLSRNVNLLMYAAPILLGMFLSGRYWQPLALRFHSITWADALGVSTRQGAVVALFIFGLIVATKDRQISRIFLAFYLITCWIILLFTNRLLPRFLSQLAFQKAHKVRALFVGPHAAVAHLGSWIRQKEHLGIDVIGLLSDEANSIDASGSIKQLGSIDALPAVIEERNISQVILLDLPSDPARTLFFIESCQTSGCRLLIHQNVWDRLPIPMVPVIEDNKFFLTVHDEPLEDPFNRGIKRVFDILVALPVVAFILPVLSIVVAIGQKLQSPGPLLFSRKRGGHRRREFDMLKFRSMHCSPPDSTSEAQQATVGDKRVYPFGAFLRKTSLDEFPQFLNVLVGDMSIVGPRPHLTQHDIEFSQVAKAYRTRQLVKPGLTGLAQIKGYRGEIRDPKMLQQRVQLDIQYITEWSIWLDVRIIIQTAVHILFPPRSAV